MILMACVIKDGNKILSATIFRRSIVWWINIKQIHEKQLKIKKHEELIPVAWHPTR